jgi:hypothetical protein
LEELKGDNSEDEDDKEEMERFKEKLSQGKETENVPIKPGKEDIDEEMEAPSIGKKDNNDFSKEDTEKEKTTESPPKEITFTLKFENEEDEVIVTLPSNTIIRVLHETILQASIAFDREILILYYYLKGIGIP